jgi:hypothetical protein
MTVDELIRALSVIDDKGKPVKVFYQNRGEHWLKLDIDGFAENDGEVLLGNDLPPEMFERDYKYE